MQFAGTCLSCNNIIIIMEQEYFQYYYSIFKSKWLWVVMFNKYVKQEIDI